MVKDYSDVSEESAVNATMQRHLSFVRLALFEVSKELEKRAIIHDLSKFSAEELGGFVRINKIARAHEFGSDEYKSSLEKEKDTIQHHYSHNSHHPQFHENVEDMGLLDIIEMVCDWWSASRAYGNSFDKSLEIAKSSHDFSEAQLWAIDEVVEFLGMVLA